jgi:hypothetical protein
MPAPRSRTGSSKGSGSRSKEVSLLGGDMFGESMFGDSLFGQTSNKKGTSIIQDIVNIQAKCIGQSINYKVAENVMELTKDNPMMVAMAPGLAMHYAKGKCMQTMFGGGGFCIPQPTQQTRNPVVTNNVMVYDMADMNAKLDKIIAEKLESAKTNPTPPAKVEEVIENETVVKLTKELTAMKAQIASLTEKNAAPDTNASVEIKPATVTPDNEMTELKKMMKELGESIIKSQGNTNTKFETIGTNMEKINVAIDKQSKKFVGFDDALARNQMALMAHQDQTTKHFDNISQRLAKLEMFDDGRDPFAEIESMKQQIIQSPVGDLGTLEAKSKQHDVQLKDIQTAIAELRNIMLMSNEPAQAGPSSATKPDKMTRVIPHQQYNNDFIKPPSLFTEPHHSRTAIDNESDNGVGAF